MPTPDDTLATIDNVITWYGSDDAMVWTAAEPKLPDLSGFAEQMQRFAEALRPAAEQMTRDIRAVADAFAVMSDRRETPAATPEETP
jgi:hypothetical protein